MRKSTLTVTCKPRYIQVLALLLSIVPALANIKTLAQTSSTQSQCSEVEIKSYIQKLSDSQPSIYNALVACNSQAVPELIEALKNQNKLVRIMAITALGEIGLPSAVPSLSNLLSTQTDRDVRVAIISALSQFGKQGVPTLINALKDKDWYIRYQAASALGEIGSAAKDAVPALNNTVKDKNVNVLAAATTALEKIKQQESCNGSNHSSFDNPVGVSMEHHVQSDVQIRVNESIKPQQTQKQCNEDKNIITSTDSANRVRHAINQNRTSTNNIRRVTSNANISGTIHLRTALSPKPPVGTVRVVSSTGLTKPPLMCRVPALRIIFKWKCSQ